MEVRVRVFFAIILIVQVSNVFASLSVQPVDQNRLTNQLETFQSLVERNLVWRTKTTQVVLSLQDQINKGLPFKAKDVRILSDFIIPEYKIIQNALLNVVDENLWMASEKTQITFSDKPTIVQVRGENVVASLNPYDEKGTFYFLHGLNSFASSTLMTDNYLLIFSQLQQT